jgi:hypothetical protein
MDSDRFDDLARAMTSPANRRIALAALVGAALGLSGGAAAEAGNKRDKRFRRRMKRRLRKLRRQQGTSSPPVTPEPSCAGSNGCGNKRCGPNDACFCRIAARDGTAFCGSAAYEVLNCGQCGGGTICVNLAGCGAGVGCATPCATF